MDFPSNIKVTSLIVHHILDVNTTENGEQVFTGVEAELLKTLASALHFKFKHFVPPDNKLGYQEESGNWTGVISMLKRQEADIGMGGIGVLSSRLEAVDFSQVYTIARLTFLVEKPGSLPATWAFVRIFDAVLWAIIFLMIIFTPLVCAPLLHLKSDLVKLYLRFFGSMFYQSLDLNPRSTSSRIFISSWLIFSVVISSSYSACLLSYLTLPSEGKPITTFVGLAHAIRKDTHRCLMLNGAPSIFLLTNSEDGDLKFLGETIKARGWFYKASEIIEPSVVEENTAVVNNAFSLEMLRAKLPPEQYFLSKDAIISFNFAIAVRKGFCCTKRLNIVLSRITAAGLFLKYQRDELLKVHIAFIKQFPPQSSDVKKLRVNDFSEIFAVLIAAHLLSLLAFIGEVIYFRVKNKKALILGMHFGCIKNDV